MKNYDQYFAHLKSISLWGRLYKRYFASQVLYYQAKKFGKVMAEIGSGTGNGVLGAYPGQVVGFEINPLAVDYCKNIKLKVHLVAENNPYPASDSEYDVCILDNVLEHIENPIFLLEECSRITKRNGGLIIAVPGNKGFGSDDDHKKHYKEYHLENLSQNWQLIKIFSMPFLIKNEFLSRSFSQYCLVAVYRKISVESL
jgi:SAM-dependent methyltransferase